MTQPSSLSGKPISQQPFKWSLRPQSLPRQSTHPTLPDPSSSCLAPLCVGASLLLSRTWGLKQPVLILAFMVPDVRVCPRARSPAPCALSNRQRESSGSWCHACPASSNLRCGFAPISPPGTRLCLLSFLHAQSPDHQCFICTA